MFVIHGRHVESSDGDNGSVLPMLSFHTILYRNLYSVDLK